MRGVPVLLVLLSMIASSACAQTGQILVGYWRDIDGTRVSDLTGSAAYPDYPHEQVYIDRLEIPSNQEANYGTRIRGYVHAPVTGAYTFYISANHQAELWISDDEKPAGGRIVASVPKWSMPRDWTSAPEQQSAPIHLTAGERYHVEVRHKNGGGDNHLTVGWRLPNGTMEAPIPGNRLSPAEKTQVPAPVLKWSRLPMERGTHEVSAEVDYLKRKFVLPFRLNVPPSIKGNAAVVLLEDPEQASVPSTRPTGFAGDFLQIVPDVNATRNQDRRATITALGAAVSELCQHYAVVPQHVGIIGTGEGGEMAWEVASAMPGFYSAVAMIGGGELQGPLPDSMAGTRVRIVTDIRDGIATEGANRTHVSLQKLHPGPQIVFLGDAELGDKTATQYCLGRADFYEWLLGYEQARTEAAAGCAAWVRWAAGAVGVVMAAGAYLWRRRRGHAQATGRHVAGR